MKLTFDELFGPEGIIPLDAFMGIGDAVCPYCSKHIHNINFPPPGVIIIHSCPICGGLVIPFVKKLVAVQKEKLNNDKEARSHITECLFNTITPILMAFASRFIHSQADLKGFLDNCWNIVFELVGEKEDSQSFLNKLRQRAVDNQYLAKEYEDYFNRMSEIFEKVVASKIHKTRVNNRPLGKWSEKEMVDYNKTIKQIKNVDDFLQKFSDTIK